VPLTLSLRLKILLLLVPSILSALVIVSGASLSLARLEDEYLKHSASVAALVGLQQFEVALLQGMNSSVVKEDIFSPQAQVIRASTMELVEKSQISLDKAVARNPSMKVIAEEFNELGDRLKALYQQISKVDVHGRQNSTRFEVYLIALSARTLLNHSLAAENSLQELAREALIKEAQTVALLTASSILIITFASAFSLWAFNQLLVRRLQRLPPRIEQYSRGDKLAALGGGDEIEALDASLASSIAALNQLHEQQLAVLQYSGDVLCSVNEEGRLTAVNQLSEVFWGYPSSLLIGAKVFDLLEHDSVSLLQSCLAQAKNSSAPHTVELKHSDPSGIDAYFLWIVRWNASTHEFLCISHDITKAKRVEMFREDIIASLNHDLRTPLMSISMAFQLLEATKGHELGADQRLALASGFAQSTKLTELVTDVLDWKKIESGNLGLNLAAVDLLEVTELSLERVSKGHDEVELEVIGATQAIAGDLLQLQKVFEIIFGFLLQTALPGDLYTATIRPGAGVVTLNLKLQSPQGSASDASGRQSSLVTQDSILSLALPMSFYLVETVLRGHSAKLSLQRVDGQYREASIEFSDVVDSSAEKLHQGQPHRGQP
jgi:PAS domain S-box-containing protein